MPEMLTDIFGTQYWYEKKFNSIEVFDNLYDGNYEFYDNLRTVIVTYEEACALKLHREDGPAVINSDGAFEYYVHGQRHRENGPAMISPDGSEFYYFDGQLHRENKPAVIYSSGKEEYWFEGKLHREDGPAVICQDGTEKYYVHGNKHRDGDNPAVIYDGGWVCYYKNDELHRDGDNPAVIFPNMVGYWKEGKRHRDPSIGPAIIHSNGCYEFWVDGEFISGVRQELYTTTYYQNGQIHRDNGPAMIEYDKNGKICRHFYYKNGLLDRVDGPAIVDFDDGKEIRHTYMQDGKYLVNNFPNVIDLSNDDNHVYYYYKKYSCLHREGGPAEYKYDGSLEIYYIDGQIHREDGPAKIIRNNDKISYFWYLKGKILSFGKWCRKMKISEDKINKLKIEYTV